MGQDLEKIINLLREMQRSNNANADSMDRLLEDLSEKFDTINTDASVGLISAYINELTKSVDDKYSVTLAKFQDIEQALRAVYNNQNEAVKNADMKELFDVFSKNVNNFYTEARQEKAILSGIEAKLSDLISNKSDKDDIIRTISLLKNDFENINHAYKSTIDDVNTNLKSILSNLINMDPTKSGETAKAQIEIMYHSVNDIVEKLQYFEEKGENLEKILANVATNKDLKITKGIIDSIIAKTYEVEQILRDVADKEDVDEIKQALEYLNKRADRIVTVDELIEIRNKTDDLINHADEVKQSLSKVAQDIENVPVGDEIEESMRKLYTQIDDLAQSIEASSVKGDMDFLNEKLENLKDELEVIKNIINDLSDVVSARVISAVDAISFDTDTQELKDSISNMLSMLPQKEDLELLFKDSKNIFKTLLERTDDISSKLDSIPEIEEDIENISKEQQNISQEQQNISQKLSDIDFEKEFSHIFDKASSIESWLLDSNIKENSEKIAAQINNTAALADLEEVNIRTNQIIESLEELTKSKDVDSVSDSLVQIDKNIAEIISVLKNSSIHDDNVEISDKLSDLERSISEIVSRNEFNDFIEDLKYCITKLSTNTGSCSENIEQMLELRNDIEEKLGSFDFSQVLRVLNGKFDQLQTRLSDSITEEVIENIQSGVTQAIASNEVFESINERIGDAEKSIASVDEFIRSNIPVNEDDFKTRIDEIKSLIVEKARNIAPSASFDSEDIDIIKDYLDDIRAIVTQDPNEELIYKISAIEDTISVNQTFNQSAFSDLADKLDDLKSDFDSIPEMAQQLEQALGEISALGGTIPSNEDIKIKKGKSSNTNTSEIEGFLTEKFDDLKKSLSGMTSVDSSGKGFAYSSALSEEKADALMDLISDLKEKSGADYGDKFDDISEKLADFKQELQLISTDITQTLNSKLSGLISGVVSVKEDAKKLKDSQSDEITKNVDALYNDVLNNELSPQNTLLIQKLHDEYTAKLQKSQSELKDVVIGDTDSIILKIDALRDYLEKSAGGLVPPVPDDMEEVKTFRTDIEEFKNSFEKSLKEAADSIISYISLQNEDIKSLITVSNNHEDIIEAIDGLKSQIRKLKSVSGAGAEDDSADTSQVPPDDYDEILSEFKKISKKIEKLSDDNASITQVLNMLEMKLDDSFVSKVTDADLDSLDDDIPISEEKPAFDFEKAFEMLQKDIYDLSKTVEGIQHIDSESDENSDIPSLEGDKAREIINSKAEDLLSSLNETWLDDIKNFITFTSDELTSKLDTINSKLDIMVSDTANTDLLEEISDTVYGVDEKISSMLEELNGRIAALNSGGDDDIAEIKELIEQQQDYIQGLEPSEKLDAFKKCLDELTVEVGNLATDKNLNKSVKEMKDSITNTVLSIFDQVSFVEESEDIKDFVEERTDEINKNLEQVTKQLQQMSSNAENDYNYSLQDIETDLAKLRLALNELKNDQSDVHSDDMAKITDKLHSISTLVDSLTQDEMKEIKSEITTLKEQTQFLIATSDKSYNALNSGIAGFEGIINESLTGKVDQVTKMLEKSADADNVIKQALIYMGEWIDSASVNINKISDNSEEIAKINDNLKILKSSINADLQKLERQFEKVESLEEQFSRQQDRIDRLEMNIDKLVSMVENIDDSTSLRKIEKIEKQLSKLGTSIEKLTSYVE